MAPFYMYCLQGDCLGHGCACRRSAVSKQGCHVLGLLAAVLGNRAEFLACHFLPMVLKIVAITVQVFLLTLGVE